MKSIQKLLVLILFIVVCSCSKDGNNFDHIEATHPIDVETRTNGSYNIPNYSPNELIVRFASTLDSIDKAGLRAISGVIAYEPCPLCPDGDIEKWMFQPNIQIEPKKFAIKTLIGIIEVDYEFTWETVVDGITVGSPDDLSYEPLVATSNSENIIAILDSGFDPDFPFWYDSGEPLPVLYNSSDPSGTGQISGWDFVNSDNNPYDDNPGKHGSAIAYEYHEILKNASVPHQILPIKVSNADGNISYFNLTCGANLGLQEASILHMSLGWYGDTFGDFESTILEDLIEEHNDVIVVTSAGNDNNFNDADAHYPSNYDADNIIAVAATNRWETNKADFSNTGTNSVDFFAAGENVPFYNYDYDPIPYGITGTSFAAPQIGAQAAILQDESGGTLSPDDVVDLLEENGIPVPASMYGMVQSDKYYSLMLD